MKLFKKYRTAPIDYSKAVNINGYDFTILRESLWPLRFQLGSEIIPTPSVYQVGNKTHIILPEETVCKYTKEMIDFTIYTNVYFHINNVKVRWIEDVHDADVFAYYKMDCDASIIRKIYEATKEGMNEHFGDIFRWWSLRYDKSILDEREELFKAYIEEHVDKKAE